MQPEELVGKLSIAYLADCVNILHNLRELDFSVQLPIFLRQIYTLKYNQEFMLRFLIRLIFWEYIFSVCVLFCPLSVTRGDFTWLLLTVVCSPFLRYTSILSSFTMILSIKFLTVSS